jgi:hypothetical protein
MKIKKRVLCPERLRRVPAQFSWIDQQLVRQPSYLQRCDLGALALYLVLVTVADAEGLSYYSDSSLEKLLRMERGQLLEARRQLCEAGLIVYEQPLYQVLSLQQLATEAAATPRAGQGRSAKEILQHILGGQP